MVKALLIFNSVFCYTFFRYVVSRFPYFTWIMLGVTLSAIAVQVYELYIPIPRLMNPKYIWLSDIVFIMATLIELVLKVFVFVCFLLSLHSPTCMHKCR